MEKPSDAAIDKRCSSKDNPRLQELTKCSGHSLGKAMRSGDTGATLLPFLLFGDGVLNSLASEVFDVANGPAKALLEQQLVTLLKDHFAQVSCL